MEFDIIINPEGYGKNKIYSISSLQVPNVVTQGKTIEEAKFRLKEALIAYFEESPEEKQKLSQINNSKFGNPPLISRIFI